MRTLPEQHVIEHAIFQSNPALLQVWNNLPKTYFISANRVVSANDLSTTYYDSTVKIIDNYQIEFQNMINNMINNMMNRYMLKSQDLDNNFIGQLVSFTNVMSENEYDESLEDVKKKLLLLEKYGITPQDKDNPQLTN